MGKSSGGVRTLINGSQEYNRRQREVAAMLASGRYSSVEFSEKGGGYVAIEKSPARHKAEEIEAAKILADKGYKVILKNEAGSDTTVDGHLFKLSYEQRTPQEAKGMSGVERSIRHARIKGADVALIYDKYRRFNKSDIIGGLKLYEQHNKHRFQKVIIIGNSGEIHVHKHNK